MSLFVVQYECMYSILPFFTQGFFVGTIRSGVATTIFTNSTMFYIRRLAVAHPHRCLDLGTLLIMFQFVGQVFPHIHPSPFSHP